MAISEELRRRIQGMVQQLHSEMGSVVVPDEACWLAVVEDLATEVGDAVATALVESQSAAHGAPREAKCPACGQSGHYRSARDRVLITRRGPATISESEFYCPGCRKAFFPDDGSDRR